MGILARRRQKRSANRLRSVLGDYQLPSFPKVLLEARALIRDPESSLQQIANRIAADPGSTIQILKTINSAAVGLRNRVNSVDQAIALLGRAQVESILLAQGVASLLPRAVAGAYDPRGFWRTAARRAVVSRTLAERLHPASASASFTASLLQDMAVPILATVLADPYHELLSTSTGGNGGLGDLERERFGWDHAEVGGWMCEAWSFPDVLIASIVGHHGDLSCDHEAPAAVQAASLLPDELDAVDIADFADHLAEAHGLASGAAEQIVVDADDASTEIALLFA